MKKLLSIALVLILALSLLAGCGEDTESEQKADTTKTTVISDLASAKAFLENLILGENYNIKDTLPISEDKDVAKAISVGDATYSVEWKIDITEGAAGSVKIGTSDKDNFVLIDLPEVAETDIYFSAIATIKGKDGKTETTTFKFKMDCNLGELDLLTKAYELADGQKLNGVHSIAGDIVEIKVPYDAASQSITVVIQVGAGDDAKLLQCNGLKGDYVDGLVVSDYICVKGTLAKSGDIVIFEEGCIMEYGSKIDGSAIGAPTTTAPSEDTTTTAPSGEATNPSNGTSTPTTQPSNGTSNQLQTVTDQAKILSDITKLGENEFLSYIAVLTGKVMQVEQYNDQYKSVTLTFKVGDTILECYQMKGNGTDKVKAGDTITVKGVIKNYYYEGATKGQIEFAWHEASGTEVTLTKLVASATQDLSTPAKILEAAFALGNQESLQKAVSLTGKVINIEEAYNASFGNITVNILVEGKTLKCYRLKGNGVDKIKEGDTITVKGTIMNYNGNIQFGTGCEMTKRVAGTASGPETDQDKILADAFALAPGTALTYKATLTGTITKIATEYNASYKNVTVIIEVGGKEIKCYRLKAPTGDGAKDLKVGDVITVTGIIKNYQHSSGDCEVEFDQGCTFVK